ncbi:MAG: GNAT family N-acetyltransferase [Actinobacteria bacterium]|nr:GNAT family N-acetyltransferase [Actinomycetota bacterium]
MQRPTLRLAHSDDAEQIASIYGPLVRDTAVTFEVDVPSASEMRSRIIDTAMRLPWLVAERDDHIAGFAYAGRHRRRAAYASSADVSIYVADGTRRLGIGRGLYTALLDLLSAQGYANVFAGIALPNDASVALHESFEFSLVGVYRSVGYKLGAWWDVAWWQRPLPPVGPTPPPPKAMVEIDRDHLERALASGRAHLAD